MAKESIVIVGTGWAGYTVSEQLDDKKFDITIISPQDTLPYTPLLVCGYLIRLILKRPTNIPKASAACGLFDFSLAEEPVRRKSKRQEYYQARVETVDFDKKICKCQAVYGLNGDSPRRFEVSYDRLVLAPG
jgi:NADH:ubiquinone reductase (non-electrogenic)